MPLTIDKGQGLVELEMGLEPTTYALQVRCATNCATPARAFFHTSSHWDDTLQEYVAVKQSRARVCSVVAGNVWEVKGPYRGSV